jgi:prepilin-type N-terminal cleavage/methylation domain-containing protein
MSTRRDYAFTLLELVIVVAIIVLLVAILVPTLNSARAQARKAQCAANLHSLGTAIVTRQGQMGLSNSFVNACGLMDLRSYLADSRVYLCPEDVAPQVSTNAQIATFKNDTQTSANFIFDMAISPGTFCWQSVLSANHYLLNFEDQQDLSGIDWSFYNFYLDVTTDAGGDVTLTSLSAAPAGDTKPDGLGSGKSWGPNTGIGGGYSYQLVDLNGGVIKAPIKRGDTAVTLMSVPTSYGMNTLYPANMASNGIIVLDFNSLAANVAGFGRASNQFTDGLNLDPKTGRPGFNRHLGRFNALFQDNSVSTSIMPTSVDPTTNGRNRQKWWGDGNWASD